MFNTLKFFFVLVIILIALQKVQASELPIYEKYADEIIASFAKEMETKYDLYCIGSGGGLAFDVREIAVRFIAYRKCSFEEAREIEVRGIQTLLNLINNHKEIRPYLREYPFTTNGIDLMISFRTPTDDFFMDGEITNILIAKNTIFYSTGKKKIIPADSLIDGNTGEVVAFFEEKESVELVTIKEEPFEEAVRLLGDNHYYQKQTQPPRQQTVSRFKYF